MPSLTKQLLAILFLESLAFGVAFLSTKLPSSRDSTLARKSANSVLQSYCRLKSWPSSNNNNRRSGRRAKLTTRAFQVSEVVAKPPEVDMTFRPQADRIVALGDVHGDLFALDTALMMSELMDEDGRWVGGKAVLVQMGDILDRGPDECECLQRLLSLQAQARAAGGDVVMLLGNHEIMNADLDFRYVDPLGWTGWDYDESEQTDLLRRLAKRPRAGPVEGYMLPRIQAMERGRGAMAEVLSKMPVAVTIGETVFTHGGLVPEVVSYGLRRLNEETAEWLRGERAAKPWVLDNCRARGVAPEAEVSPLWHRAVGKEDVCWDALAEVDAAMRLLGAKRLVVGHTPQAGGVNCVQTQEGREVWRVDTGMSEGILGGHVETLEIAKGKKGKESVHVVHMDGVSAAHARVSRRAENPTWKKELHAPVLEGDLRMPVLTMP